MGYNRVLKKGRLTVSSFSPITPYSPPYFPYTENCRSLSQAENTAQFHNGIEQIEALLKDHILTQGRRAELETRRLLYYLHTNQLEKAKGWVTLLEQRSVNETSNDVTLSLWADIASAHYYAFLAWHVEPIDPHKELGRAQDRLDWVYEPSVDKNPNPFLQSLYYTTRVMLSLTDEEICACALNAQSALSYTDNDYWRWNVAILEALTRCHYCPLAPNWTPFSDLILSPNEPPITQFWFYFHKAKGLERYRQRVESCHDRSLYGSISFIDKEMLYAKDKALNILNEIKAHGDDLTEQYNLLIAVTTFST